MRRDPIPRYEGRASITASWSLRQLGPRLTLSEDGRLRRIWIVRSALASVTAKEEGLGLEHKLKPLPDPDDYSAASAPCSASIV